MKNEGEPKVRGGDPFGPRLLGLLEFEGIEGIEGTSCDLSLYAGDRGIAKDAFDTFDAFNVQRFQGDLTEGIARCPFAVAFVPSIGRNSKGLRGGQAAGKPNNNARLA